MHCVATCAKGLEDLLAAELTKLGLAPDKPGVGAVGFESDWPGVWKANLWLRTANRVLVELGSWSGARKERLYGGLRKLLKDDDSSLFHPRSTFAFRASTAASEMDNAQQVALICKDALVDHQRDRWGERADVDRDDPDLRLRVRLYRNQATLLLDTSGLSLDHRGYRVSTTPAPMRETLAAACILASGWDFKGPVVDPMCGSGTLLIEAGRMALGLRPAARPRTYAFQRLPGFQAKGFKELMEGQAPGSTKVRLYGADIEPRALDACEDNAKAARLSSYLQLQQGHVLGTRLPPRPGLLCMNPPHGMRLHEDQAMRGELGQWIRDNARGWTVVILAGGDSPGKGWGMKPELNLRVFNGNLRARILVYRP
ncbi:MAG: hypothetical protein VX899_16085 [Myxococcota bacterium]|nr:hypothetical protein [Myxococcota bacterium]